MSLADALAMGRRRATSSCSATRSSSRRSRRARTPEGAGRVGARAPARRGADTIPPDRGLFLERTFRMHPDVAASSPETLYEGRLGAAPECARQSTAFGTGMRFSGRARGQPDRSSPRRRKRSARRSTACAAPTGRTARSDASRSALSDFMVVAPYNAQVACAARGACRRPCRSARWTSSRARRRRSSSSRWRRRAGRTCPRNSSSSSRATG